MTAQPIRFSSFVVKLASRCNLNCDYCYMYKHADQSWKNKPKVLSERHRELFVERLKEYISYKKLDRILLIYHGGEPLLFGVDNILHLTDRIRTELAKLNCQADFGIQTNGVLLKEDILKKFDEYNISVSLSIDGPKEMHDIHRLDLKNRPTFDKVYHSLSLLKTFPKIFTGCISVINPHFDPYKFFKFCDENQIMEFNILLPDANYMTPPLGRTEQPNLYKDWLIQAFDCWFDHFSHLKCKFFDWIVMAIMGRTTETDYFGLGDVSLLVLETDGTYHNHDVLKITEENTSSLGLSLENNPIADAERSEKILFHRHLLTKEGLSPQCQSCKHLNICGGGFIAHRFSEQGYKNPTIYCEEMYSLIDHITLKIRRELEKQKSRDHQALLPEFDTTKMQMFWDSSRSLETLKELENHVCRKNYNKLHVIIPSAIKQFPQQTKAIEAVQKLSFEQLKPALLQPPIKAWLRSIYGHCLQSPVSNIEGKVLPPYPEYFEKLARLAINPPEEGIIIQLSDPWYRLTLGSNINLEHSIQTLEEGKANLQQALQIIQHYDPALYQELSLISRHIQLVKDSNAPPDKDVSFSDETIPGAIFLSVWKSDGLLSPYIVAASLIHEHLHQKLYLLLDRFELFTNKDVLIYSPWPKIRRPPSGALHAVFVFTFVAKFWNFMLQNSHVDDSFSAILRMHLEGLEQCIGDIKREVSFTTTGRLFFDCLLSEYQTLVEQSIFSQV